MSSSRSPYLKFRASEQQRQAWYGLARLRNLTFSQFLRSLLEREALTPPQQFPAAQLQRRRDLARCLTWLQNEFAGFATHDRSTQVDEIFTKAFVLLSEIEQEVTQ